MSIADPALCIQRSEAHRNAAIEIAATESELGREWAAVCLFYAAYHRARAAMLRDPIFESAQRLAAINPRLCMQDRTVSHHTGGKSRGYGVRDIVALLYPSIKIDYAALHQASIDVRYGNGTPAPLEDLMGRCDLIREKSNRGLLSNPA